MPHRKTRRLTIPDRFCIVAIALGRRFNSPRISQERAMHLYSSYFAFTYRFLYAGKRAGETRANQSTH
jgi:hypothetical protein